MRQFCTYFDKRYLVRGLTLYRSLTAVEDIALWVLCLDDETRRALDQLKWPGIRAISIQDLERADEALAAVKRKRTPVEYYFTCTPSWISYVLQQSRGECDSLAYVDADLFFYDSTAQLDLEFASASILLTAHRFPPEIAHMEKFGNFNVSFLLFRNDSNADKALRRWRTQCLEWCHDRLEDGKFGDQKYLDDWPDAIPGVREVQHPGAGVAPWNWSRFEWKLTHNGTMIDGAPLIFFHFHDLRLFLDKFYDPGRFGIGAPPPSIRRWLYENYIAALRKTSDAISPFIGSFPLCAGLPRYSRIRYLARLTRRLLRGEPPLFLAD
jgi:hypothetical protein